MLTALARCWSAALTPARRGSTSSPMSRRPPARRAVTTPEASALTATPRPSSPEVEGAGRIGGTGAATGLGTDAGVATGAGRPGVGRDGDTAGFFGDFSGGGDGG